jgi:hypothetical protein
MFGSIVVRHSHTSHCTTVVPADTSDAAAPRNTDDEDQPSPSAAGDADPMVQPSRTVLQLRALSPAVVDIVERALEVIMQHQRDEGMHVIFTLFNLIVRRLLASRPCICVRAAARCRQY